MHVFVTGATGWVGSALVRDLVAAGHRVSGLSRSRDKAAGLAASGATVVEGTLDDLDTLRRAAGAADAVAHLAFNHDFSRFAASAEEDRLAIEAMGDVLAGSGRPMLVTSGVAHLAPGRVATEADTPDPAFPRRSEVAARSLRERGVRAGIVRLAPTVHGIGESHGFVPALIRLARDTGVSAYPGDGLHHWPAVHRTDAARLYRLALEAGVADPAYHALAEEGVPFREIAAAIGRGLGVPVEARETGHFGWLAPFASMDMSASAGHTRARLNWEPTGPGLLADLAGPGYYAAA